MQHMRAHDQQRTFRIITIAAATARNIRLAVEMIIASHTNVAYQVEISLKERRRIRVSVHWLVLSLRVKCRAIPLGVLYSLRCLEGITFQIE